ncbi:alpha/beta fold hydrolase [Rhodococcoides kyotonense]|uniref:Pimeloyl-ACP methyl ester carboxylesterase n=1 Tax=Rhodococcoides kyotonense TaxID=398843 RepID=A0A239H2W9_9NOCA|nr:alpha/beta hydrolase [Rhodococcus kyotonensis]SNS75727.1 Pimeloyl-ACP methyl ester carboxylesterase [Rhodococcus kyotonensis]
MNTRTLDLPDATLTYDIRGDLAAGTVPLLLIGSPMDASGFTTLASHFADRVVVTYDPRNAGRSRPADATAGVTAQQHADDLHALIDTLGSGQVDIFASSGGAVNGLELVARHPGDVRTLVAHEPPAGDTLRDRENLRQVCSDMVSTYDALGLGPAMAKFIALVMHRGPVDDAYLAQPAPDPAAFGMSASDDGSRTDPLMSNMRGGGANYAPDVDAIRASSTHVVIGVGEESGGPVDGELAVRAGYAVAMLLGSDPVVFPGGHAGFSGGEFGQTGRPDEFAATLRSVLMVGGTPL